MTTATMDGEVFRMLRGDGLSEELAAKWAGWFARREGAIQSDIAELRAEIPDREAERAERKNFATKVDVANLRAEIPGREDFAAKDDVTVLQTKATTVEAAIVRIDKSIESINETLVSMKEMLARTDERINGLQAQNDKFFYIFFSLHVVTITGLIALLTKGSLWGVVP